MEISNRLYINSYKPFNPISSKIGEKEETMGYSSMPNCCPAYFSPSFTAMKKKEFTGIDRLVVEKYNAPIQDFNSHDDFDAWADDRCEEIYNKAYPGKSEYTAQKRKSDLRTWWKNIYRADSEYDFYTPAQRLLIIDGITKDLGEDNDSSLPAWKREDMAQTMFALMLKTESGKRVRNYDFEEAYKNHAENSKWNIPSIPANVTGWVKIPSKEHDPENYKTNLIKLSAVLPDRWITLDGNSLLKGDYHVYLEKGVPKVGIEFKGDKAEEICNLNYGEKSCVIPFRYYDECLKYVKDNKLDLSNQARNDLKNRKATINEFTPIIEKINNSSSEEIFNILGIETQKDKNGMLTISHFDRSEKMKENGITFDDLGIDLDKLLKNVKEIKGDADFRGLIIKSIPNLELVGGNARFSASIIDEMPKLKEIRGKGTFCYSKIKDLSGLEKIGGCANFDSALIGNMSKLRELPGVSTFQYTEIDDFSGLKTIKNADFHCAKIRNLSGLETIEKDASLQHAEIEDMSGLKSIGGDARCQDAIIGDISGLASIGGDVWCRGAIIGNMSGLTSVGESAFFGYAVIKGEGLPNLRKIGEDVDFEGAYIPNIEELKDRFKDKIKK